LWTLACFAAIAGLFALALRRDVSLNLQIALGALVGLGFGAALVVVFGDAAGDQPAVAWMRTAGRIFISALKMVIVPMILLSIVVSIASMRRTAELGRTGGTTLVLYAGTMALAVATGLIVVNLLEPGSNGTLRESSFFQSRVDPGTGAVSQALDEFLLKTVYQGLSNPFESLNSGRILPIVFFAVLFGVALARIGTRAEVLVDSLGAALDAVMQIVRWFMHLAPLGVMGLLAHLVATLPLRDLGETAAEIGIFFAAVWGAACAKAPVCCFMIRLSPRPGKPASISCATLTTASSSRRRTWNCAAAATRWASNRAAFPPTAWPTRWRTAT